MNAPLPPVVRTITVPATPEAAFRRFTAELHTWWPMGSHSVCGRYIDTVRFEGHVGGRIYERAKNGAEFEWGVVKAWDPPRRVAFTWHPGMKPGEVTDVELSFEPVGSSTRLTLRHFNWESLGRAAKRAQKGYGIGWKGVLDVYAGRWSFIVALTGVVDKVVRIFMPPPAEARAPKHAAPRA